MNQHTISNNIIFTGKGLHTGCDVTMTCHPADINTGIRFIRTDLNNELIIPNIDNVKDTCRATTLCNANGVYIKTVEHLLSSLFALSITNIIIEINNNEIPCLDGCSYCFTQSFIKNGIIDQFEPIKRIKVNSKLKFSYQNMFVTVIPNKNMIIDVTVDFNDNIFPSINHAFNLDKDDYFKDISYAKTFCYKKEIDMLLKQGLIKGGNYQIANVLDNNNIDTEIAKECCKHKILDIIGDYSLLGQRILGKIIVKHSSHSGDYQFIKFIRNVFL